MKNLFKHKHIKLGKQYVRYLFSYALILMIPLIILTFFYSSRFMKKFYDEIYETVDAELVQLDILMENEWTSMEKIAGQLFLNQTIHQSINADTPLDLQPVIAELSGFASANPFLSDIALVLEDQDFVTTVTTTVQKDYYFKRIFQLPDTGKQDLEALFTSPSPICLPSQQVLSRSYASVPQDMMLFSFPLYSDYQKREGTMLFFVSDSAIQNLINKKLKSYQSQVYIMNQAGRVLTTSGPSPDAISSENDEYIIRSYAAPRSHWSYYAYLPNQQNTFAQVTALTNEFVSAIMITLILASLAIFALQKINYTPVRELMNTARKISPEIFSANEFETISDALDYLSIQNTTLSSRLSRSLSATKNERISRLLNGNYASRQDFNLDCSELDLYLPGDCSAIGIIMFHKPVDDLDSLAYDIKQQFDIPSTYYYLHAFHQNQLVLLVNFPGKPSSLDRCFENTQKYLLNNYGLPTTIGIGTTVNSMERIAQSYMEASGALDYRFIKGNGTVILFREILGSTQASVLYPQEEFGALRNSLRSYNEQNIRNSVQKIISFIEESPMPMYLARSICYDLIHLVNGYYHSQNPASDSSPMNLSGMETAQEIIQMLRSWSDDLDSQTVSDPPAGRAPVEDILSYLAANCLSCDFSAYETAEHFQMTLPAFSKFFKDATGQNVMDYTIQTRIQKAKELLVSTNFPLKDISEQVGYYNVSSFTRRFKLNQGITPGEYRKNFSAHK